MRQKHVELLQHFEGDLGFASFRIQTERTLDEAHYPSLSSEVLDGYNKDQVITRECKTTVDGTPVEGDARPILMVSQLWVWRFGNYLLSSNPVFEKAPDDILREHRNDHLAEWHDLRMDQTIDENSRSNRRSELLASMYQDAEECRRDWAGPGTRLRGHEPLHQIGTLLALQIERFGGLQANDTFQSPLDYFEIGVARVMSDVNEYTRHTDTETLDIKREEHILHDFSDIRGELYDG